ncbi:MAG TPA: AbrB/MazE/SpoVT family DNA-binding domain-containing protein [Iamia sp.]|nr:AbrB/MazE/SpoVT family DNA-binding domain-containing protein [Iamia sp.]
MTMGDRGRVVIPAELRQREGWTQGTTLLLIDTDEGVLLLTRDQLRDRIQRDLAGGPSLVDELIAERGAAAAEEDRESGY